MDLCLPAQCLVQIEQVHFVMSASVLCCQLQVRGGWELPSHKETCQGKRDSSSLPAWGRQRAPTPGSFQAAGGCPRLVARPLPSPSRGPHSRWSTVRAASLRDQRLLLVRVSRAEPSQLTRPPPWPGVQGGARGHCDPQTRIWAGSETLPCISQSTEHSCGGFREGRGKRGEGRMEKGEGRREKEERRKGRGEEGCSAQLPSLRREEKLRSWSFIKPAGFSRPCSIFRLNPTCTPFLTHDCAHGHPHSRFWRFCHPLLGCPLLAREPPPAPGWPQEQNEPSPPHAREERSRLLLWFRRDQGLDAPPKHCRRP